MAVSCCFSSSVWRVAGISEGTQREGERQTLRASSSRLRSPAGAEGDAPSPRPRGEGARPLHRRAIACCSPGRGARASPHRSPGGQHSPHEARQTSSRLRVAWLGLLRHRSPLRKPEAGPEAGPATDTSPCHLVRQSPVLPAVTPGILRSHVGAGGCASFVVLRWDRAKACAGRRGGLSVTVGRPLGKHPGVSFKRSVMVFWFSCILTLLVLPSKTNFRSFACDTVVTAMVSGG